MFGLMLEQWCGTKLVQSSITCKNIISSEGGTGALTSHTCKYIANMQKKVA